jgi:sugar phosphate isomerase/epimerase
MIRTMRERLAVCSWSLQPGSPQQLVDYLRATGISRVQLALDPLREQPATWETTPDIFRREGIEIVSGMFGTVDEDYATMESIRRTGGLVPDSTWDENWENIQATALLAQQMGLNLVTFHAGFLPEDEAGPEYEKIQHRVRLVADLFASKEIDLAFETGQETAGTLAAFLEKLGRSHVGVNFDPANMLLYDKGNPIDALRILRPWVKQCHIKDANRTVSTGIWGDEVVVGTGQVDWAAFFSLLQETEYGGDLCIEREVGDQRILDIIAARLMVERLEQVPVTGLS